MKPKIVAVLETFDLHRVRDRQVRNLSLGEKRRLEIAMSVLAAPEVLLLDEPLAGLSESEIQGVLEVLRRHIGRQTILIVEHKISHVKDFVERLIVMHEGRMIAEGGYEECLQHPEVRKSYWQIEPAEGEFTMTADGAISRAVSRDSRTGSAYGESQVLFDIDFDVGERQIVACVGRNGAGKTTLLRSDRRFLKPQSGTVVAAGADLTGHRPYDVARSASSTCRRTRKCSPT